LGLARLKPRPLPAPRLLRQIMELTELDRLRNAYIGVLGVSGLSVEQRKRLTIAVELVANPSIVFMDEPTTGLDARAASLVMSTVRATVNTGRTVGEPWEGPRPLPPCFRHRCAAGPRHAC
jgi:ABC-type multidrug transport system ATPase subunit